MSLTLASLRRQLRENIGLEGDDITNLPDSDSSDKTGADTYLNRSYWEIIDKFKFREKEVTSTFSTVAGTKSYTVPVPTEAIVGIAVTDPDTSAHMPLDSMTKDYYEQVFVATVDQQAIPTSYYREDDQIILWPTPADVYEITVHRYTILADLASGGPDLPQSWHEILLFGAVWRAFIGVNGDYVKAQAAKAHQISLTESSDSTESKEMVDTHRAGVEVPGYDERNQ